MKHLKPFKSQDLLVMLVAMLELQIRAVNAKRMGGHIMEPLLGGICNRVPAIEGPDGIWGDELHDVLFQHCPSYSGSRVYPVKTPPGYAYDGWDLEHTWGDNPYADNRRQLLGECIKQLQVTLRKRGDDV